MAITHISVRGARQHNLRDISVRIPRNTLTVVTGLSGSGKSSLAFDTIYAEGQRRYVETLSAYARQFLDQIERPDVDSIEGLSARPSPSSRRPPAAAPAPPLAPSPRFTTTCACYMPLSEPLIALTAAVPLPARPRTRLSSAFLSSAVVSASPLWRPSSAAARANSKTCSTNSTSRAFAPASTANCATSPSRLLLDRRKNHSIEAIVDRILLKTPAAPTPLRARPGKPSVENRLEKAVSKALQLANGLVLVAVAGGEEQLFSSSMACPDCGLDVPKLEPRSFSFNSTFGACPECHGLGSLYDLDPAKVITDWSKPLLDGGLGPGSSSQYLLKLIHLAADRYKIDLEAPL